WDGHCYVWEVRRCKRHDHGSDQDVTTTFPEPTAPIKKPNDYTQYNQQKNIKRGFMRAVQLQHKSPPTWYMRHYINHK
ncbi:TPA: hypothetical protein ACTYBS_004942, partial [Citrobacter freundii]